MNDEKKLLFFQHAKDIVAFETGDPEENPWVSAQPKVETVEVAAYDLVWPMLFQTLKSQIGGALNGTALTIEHVGSTAVPDLPAKPVIDIDVIVANPEDESGYVPALEKLGYTLTIRERSWYQHRMLRLDTPRVNVHIFGPDCPEHMRHILFREWLRAHPEDRRRYTDAKMLAKEGASTVQTYNSRKESVIKEIYTRIFESYGFLSC